MLRQNSLLRHDISRRKKEEVTLEDILGCAVDLGTEDALREHLREPVLKEAIRAF